MNEVLRALKAQKTTRRDQFSNRPVEPEALDEIREAILKTANASNRQSYSVLSLDAEHAQGLRLPGKHVFLFCVDFHRLKRCAERLGADFDSRYLMQFITAQTDISMLAQSAILAAQSLRIDTLLTNEIYHLRLDEVFGKLQIPDRDVFPMLALCLGYAKTPGAVPKGRLPAETIFHENAYRPLTDAEADRLIGAYDDPENHLCLIQDWQAQGYAHYMDWFFGKWSPVVGSRRQSDALTEHLKAHGMIE